MQAINHRAGQARLALMVIFGVAAAAACVVTLMWWKAPVASAQVVEEEPIGEASFVVRCDFSHRKQVDPIVSPGAKSFHIHDFFGNRTTNANSTLASLQAGTTTCSRIADKAAYWIPTVKWTNPSGTRTLTADQGLFYYRLAGKDPNVDVRPHPVGLKVVTVQGSNVEWRCAGGTYSTTPPTQCSNGKMVVRIKFPDCSDGTLDSADHRSHMVHAVQQSDGTRLCPSAHPTPVPQLHMNVRFPMPTTTGKVKLSSGDYSTMHADFYNAWDATRLAELVGTCINAGPFTASNPKPEDCKVTGG
jgi:hypothetical protein